MAKLFQRHQLSQGVAKDDQASKSSDVHDEPVQGFGESSDVRDRLLIAGRLQTDIEDTTTNDAAADLEAHQESNAVVWEEMAAQ